MTVYATKHAIERYRQRVENCSKADARERLIHAASIARLPSMKQMKAAKVDLSDAGVLLYCPVESLMLCCRRKSANELAIATVFRLEDK